MAKEKKDQTADKKQAALAKIAANKKRAAAVKANREPFNKRFKNFIENIIPKTKKWFFDMKSEIKKISWPTLKQVINNTIIVLLFVAVVGSCVWIFDLIFSELYRAFINLF